MAKYTFTITDNTTHKTIGTKDFDAFFGGYADEEGHGTIAIAEATGFVISLALNSAEEAIEACENKMPLAHAARMFLKNCENESENEDE